MSIQGDHSGSARGVSSSQSLGSFVLEVSCNQMLNSFQDPQWFLKAPEILKSF